MELSWLHGLNIHEEIQEVYFHRFLYILGIGGIRILLPLYLYKLGTSPMLIFLFYILYFSVFIITTLPAGLLSSKIGYKHTSLIGAPFILLFYFILRGLNSPSELIFLTAVVGGLGASIYWMGMNSEIAGSSHKEKSGSEVGFAFSVPAFASIVAPLLAGSIVFIFNFRALLLFVMVVAGTSFVPLFFTSERYEGMEMKIKKVFNRSHTDEFLTFLFHGAADIGKKALWPIFLAVLIAKSLEIGGAGSLIALNSAIFSIVGGHLSDTWDRKKVFYTGAILVGVTWILMGFVTTTFQALIFSFLYGGLWSLTFVSIYSKFMDEAVEEDIIEDFALREIALNLGRIGMLAISAGLLLLTNLETALTWMLVLTGIACFIHAKFGGRLF